MIKLKCTAPGGFQGAASSDTPVMFAEGETQEVDDKVAERLLEDFGDWFEVTKAAAAQVTKPAGGQTK